MTEEKQTQEQPKTDKKPTKKKNKAIGSIISIMIAILAVPIVILSTLGIYNAVQYQYKATYTSIEYSYRTNVYIKIEHKNDTTLEASDFVMTINDNPTPANGFIVDGETEQYITITQDTTIVVYFNYTKSTINQPVELYLNGEKLSLNKTIKIK